MLSAQQIKAARALAGWNQRELARRSGLSLPTIQRMEVMGPGRSSAENVEKMTAALTGVGIEFLFGDAPGVRIRLKDAKGG